MGAQPLAPCAAKRPIPGSPRRLPNDRLGSKPVERLRRNERQVFGSAHSGAAPGIGQRLPFGRLTWHVPEGSSAAVAGRGSQSGFRSRWLTEPALQREKTSMIHFSGAGSTLIAPICGRLRSAISTMPPAHMTSRSDVSTICRLPGALRW
jgi:hypothetical protein